MSSTGSTKPRKTSPKAEISGSRAADKQSSESPPTSPSSKSVQSSPKSTPSVSSSSRSASLSSRASLPSSRSTSPSSKSPLSPLNPASPSPKSSRSHPKPAQSSSKSASSYSRSTSPSSRPDSLPTSESKHVIRVGDLKFSYDKGQDGKKCVYYVYKPEKGLKKKNDKGKSTSKSLLLSLFSISRKGRKEGKKENMAPERKEKGERKKYKRRTLKEEKE